MALHLLDAGVLEDALERVQPAPMSNINPDEDYVPESDGHGTAVPGAPGYLTTTVRVTASPPNRSFAK